MRLPESQKLLDDVRLLCRGKKQAYIEVYERFNRETDDGRNMADSVGAFE